MKWQAIKDLMRDKGNVPGNGMVFYFQSSDLIRSFQSSNYQTDPPASVSFSLVCSFSGSAWIKKKKKKTVMKLTIINMKKQNSMFVGVIAVVICFIQIFLGWTPIQFVLICDKIEMNLVTLSLVYIVTCLFYGIVSSIMTLNQS